MRVILIQGGWVVIENVHGQIREQNNALLRRLALRLKDSAKSTVTREKQAHGTIFTFSHELDEPDPE